MKKKRFILLSLYTGARKSNVLPMNQENISFADDKTLYIPGNSSKNDAMNILKSTKKYNKAGNKWIFLSPTSANGILMKAGIEDLRLHYFRRMVGNWMSIAPANT